MNLYSSVPPCAVQNLSTIPSTVSVIPSPVPSHDGSPCLSSPSGDCPWNGDSLSDDNLSGDTLCDGSPCDGCPCDGNVHGLSSGCPSDGSSLSGDSPSDGTPCGAHARGHGGQVYNDGLLPPTLVVCGLQIEPLRICGAVISLTTRLRAY